MAKRKIYPQSRISACFLGLPWRWRQSHLRKYYWWKHRNVKHGCLVFVTQNKIQTREFPVHTDNNQTALCNYDLSYFKIHEYFINTGITKKHWVFYYFVPSSQRKTSKLNSLARIHTFYRISQKAYRSESLMQYVIFFSWNTLGKLCYIKFLLGFQIQSAPVFKS